MQSIISSLLLLHSKRQEFLENDLASAACACPAPPLLHHPDVCSPPVPLLHRYALAENKQHYGASGEFPLPFTVASSIALAEGLLNKLQVYSHTTLVLCGQRTAASLPRITGCR